MGMNLGSLHSDKRSLLQLSPSDLFSLAIHAPLLDACIHATFLSMLMQILVIALLMRFILKRHFTIWQWEALVLLMAGITVNQLSNCG